MDNFVPGNKAQVEEPPQPTESESSGLSFPSAGDELQVKWSGFLLAGFAFIWTRFPVVTAVYETSGRSFLTSLLNLLPLLLGLVLVVIGVSLAVSTHSRSFARTVVSWYFLGTMAMLFLTGGTMLGAGHAMGEIYRSSVFASSVIGGGLGGALFGRTIGQQQIQQSQLDRQRDQSVLLNRLLRHEILNALTSIRGHAALLADGNGTSGSRQAVEQNSERIVETIEEVGVLVQTSETPSTVVDSVALDRVLRSCCDSVGPAEITFSTAVPHVNVRGEEHLETVFEELLRTATERSGDNPVAVSVTTDGGTARVAVTGSGQWLSDIERCALEEHLPEYDSPEIGYGLCMSRLLVDFYGGRIEVTERSHETEVSVILPMTETEPARSRNRPGVDGTTMQRAVVAGTGGGIAMGLVLQLTSGSMAVIGGLYDIPTLTVGWVTHLFHSIVFATLFAAIAPRFEGSPGGLRAGSTFLFGIGYSILLWIFAGGVIMGIWLNALGIPSPVPDLGLPGFVGHAVWGLTLAGTFVLLDDWSGISFSS